VSSAHPSELSRPDRLWPAVVASLAAHAALFSAAAAVRQPGLYEPGQKAITARLVRLGQERPKELLPRKEAAPPPAEEAPAPVAAPPGPTPVPIPAQAAPAARPAAPRAAAKPASAAKGGRPGGSRLSSVLSQLTQEIQEGSPEGDPLGDAGQAEGDQYLAAVVQALRQNYRLPSTIPERERHALQGTLVLHVARDGRILSFEFAKRSGNPVFDEALERAVRQTRLPPPPAALRDTYLNGFEVDFRIKS
jgi:colicin import membrane protein/protein TonB